MTATSPAVPDIERFLRVGVGRAVLGIARGEALVSWVADSDYTGGRSLGVLPHRAGIAARQVLDEAGEARQRWGGFEPDSLTIDAATFEATTPAERAELFAGPPARWSWWWAAAPPPPMGAGASLASARVLDAGDTRIDALLAHSRSAYVKAGDPRVRRWHGLEVGSELVACAAVLGAGEGAVQVVSVCVAPERRGQGLARAMMTSLIRDAFDEGARGVCLEMYSDNDAGRALYSGLGFVEALRLASGRLPAA